MRTVHVELGNTVLSQLSRDLGIGPESALARIKNYPVGSFYHSIFQRADSLFVPQMRAYFLLDEIDSDLGDYRAVKMKFLESTGVSTVPVYVEYGHARTFKDLLPAFLR
ncbi:MAG: hypothetical protein V1836_00230 [Candidatus Aenigmatarchaeota archaeon]